MTGYEWVYKLKPIKEVEPGWWKLRWRPIKGGTWNAYSIKHFTRRYWQTGLLITRDGVRNGWGRFWESMEIIMALGFIKIHAWIRWNIVVQEHGPDDVAEKDKRPLDVPTKYPKKGA